MVATCCPYCRTCNRGCPQCAPRPPTRVSEELMLLLLAGVKSKGKR